MIDAQRIRDNHHACECFVQDCLDDSGDSASLISHQGCQLRIQGFRLAIDCDRCCAFDINETRPDLLVLRERDGACEWIVIEIKRTMDRQAKPQVEAGLRALADHSLFADLQNCKPHALFAFTHRLRTQDQTRLRHRIESRGKVVAIHVKRCGTTVI